METRAAYFDMMRAGQCLPALTDITLRDLPYSIRTIARQIGLPAALALVDSFGGLTLRIAQGERVRGQAMLAMLAAKVGEDAASRLAQEYGATQLYIPNCKPALLKARNRQLLADRASLAAEGLSERHIVQCLALRYRISDRYVWEILKKPLGTAPPEQAQGRLL